MKAPFAAVLAAALSAAAAAAEPVPALPFAVGDWAPYVGASLSGLGFAARLVEAACAASGLLARFEFYPWIRAEQRTADGEAFASFPYIAVAERTADFFFSDVVVRSSVAILRSEANGRTASFRFRGDPAAFAPFAVGTTAGSLAVTTPLRAAGARVEETVSVDQSVLKLERGRIDFVVDERLVLVDALRRLYPRSAPPLSIDPEPFLDGREYRLMVSRRFPDAEKLLERFNAGLAAIKADGTYERIRREAGL